MNRRATAAYCLPGLLRLFTNVLPGEKILRRLLINVFFDNLLTTAVVVDLCAFSDAPRQPGLVHVHP